MKTLLAVKLKRELLAVNAGLTVQLKNVTVNGEKMGCSGFVTDPGTGRIIYINTDHNHSTNHRALFRVALHDKDFRGGINHFAEYGELAEEAVDLLKGQHFDRELRAA